MKVGEIIFSIITDMDEKPQKTILLVEDEAVIAISEKIEIERFGYDVLVAHSGEEAIDMFKDNQIDLILMDIDLGEGLCGAETASIILKDNDVPIIFLSSHTEPEVVEKTEKITSYGFIVKGSVGAVVHASIKMAFKLFNANTDIKNKERLLHSIAENYPNSFVAIIEADYTVGFTSGHEFKKINKNPEEYIGINLDKAFGAHSDLVRRNFEKTFKGEECSFEFNIGGSDLLIRTVPLYSEDGGINQILSVAENITEQKQAEKDLYESEQKFSKTFHSAPILIAITSNETAEFIDVNDTFLSITGYCPEEVIGHTSAELNLFSREDSERMKKLIYKDGSFYNQEFTLRLKSGENRYAVASSQIININGKQCSITAARDITDRKQAEKSLEENEEKFRLIAEQSILGISILQNGKYIYNNKATEMITGFTQAELSTWAPQDFLQLVHPEDLRTIQASIKKKLETGSDEASCHACRIFDKRGEIKWIESFSKAIDYKGERAVLMLFADITKRKRADEALERALQRNKDLLSELQHRARNSFAMISSMIILAIDSSASEEAKTALSDTGSRIKAISELYDSLDVSDSLNEFRLDKYLNKILSSFKNISKNITLKSAQESANVPVKIAAPVGIIVTELITNAIKHAFPGDRSGLITLTLKKSHSSIYVEVEDNGAGLPEGFDASPKNSLGLSLVRALVNQIDGNLTIAKLENSGTQCIVEFPV